MKKSREPTGAVSFLHRIAEQRILEAQRDGAFDNLPGKGKPLELEDLSWVPEDLRIGYHVLKNAHVLPPRLNYSKIFTASKTCSSTLKMKASDALWPRAFNGK